MEGKDQKKDRGKPEFKADYGENGVLIMQMTNPLFVTWNTVLLGSVFCVMKGVVGMLAHVVYAMTVINKKGYWPKYCKGDSIEAFF